MDWALLRELQADARLSFSELSRRVHLSPPAVAERVRRLEESGVITGYHAHVDLARAGRTVVALIRMSCYGARCILHDPAVAGWPEILEIHRITGDACSVLKVAAGSIGEFEAGHRPARPVRPAVEHDGPLHPAGLAAGHPAADRRPDAGAPAAADSAPAGLPPGQRETSAGAQREFRRSSPGGGNHAVSSHDTTARSRQP